MKAGRKAGNPDQRFDYALAISNCAKMGLSMADARGLSWWEYNALVWGHQPEGADEEAEAPDAGFVNSRMERLKAMGMVH